MTYLISTITALWLLAAIIQLYYWLVVAWPLARHKPRTRPMSEPVSVIICTNQKTNNLRTLLTDILNQNYPEFEVILVNDGPDNDVRMLLNTLIPYHDNIKVVPFDASAKQTGGKKEPLAAGIAHAQYDWLLLTDSDCHVQPGWIQSMMECASKKKPIVLGYAPLINAKSVVNAISRLDTAMIAMQYMSFALKGWPYMGVGRNLLYHRRLYDRVGGFSDHMNLASGDDDLFVQSIATRENVAVNLDPKSFVYSSAKKTWGELFNQKRRHVSTSVRYQRPLKARIGLVGISFIAMWIGGLLIASVSFGVPALIFLVCAVMQWVVFGQIAGRLGSDSNHGHGMRRYALLYPFWAIGYAVYLMIIGIIALSGRPPKTWNPS